MFVGKKKSPERVRRQKKNIEEILHFRTTEVATQKNGQFFTCLEAGQGVKREESKNRRQNGEELPKHVFKRGRARWNPDTSEPRKEIQSPPSARKKTDHLRGVRDPSLRMGKEIIRKGQRG